MIELFEYQKEGVEFLKSKFQALLADEMGLGKTVQAIIAAKELNLNRIHVICPATAKIHWQREFTKFWGRDSYLSKKGELQVKARIAITSFEYASKFAHIYKNHPRDLIIIDEGHFLKEPSAKRTQAILGKHGLLHSCKRFWVLSGTPAPNHAGELWVMLYTFGYTTLTYDGFISRYCNVRRTGGHYSRIQITGTNTSMAYELRDMLQKFSLRRMQQDVLKDLPPIFHSTYAIKADETVLESLSPELKDKIQKEYQMLIDAAGYNGNIPSDDKILDALQVLSQSISSLRRYHGLQKITPVVKIIKHELEMNLYDKIVIFGIHRDLLLALKRGLEFFNPVLLFGGMTDLQKQSAIDKFQNDENCRVFIGNIKAAGIAISLTKANQVAFVEQEWVPGDNAQAAKRCHRIGQDQATYVRHFMLDNSFDEKIVSTLKRKAQELSTFIS